MDCPLRDPGSSPVTRPVDPVSAAVDQSANQPGVGLTAKGEGNETFHRQHLQRLAVFGRFLPRADRPGSAATEPDPPTATDSPGRVTKKGRTNGHPPRKRLTDDQSPEP